MSILTESIEERTKILLYDIVDVVREGKKQVYRRRNDFFTESADHPANQIVIPDSVPVYTAALLFGGYVAFIEVNKTRVEINRSRSVIVLREDVLSQVYMLSASSSVMYRYFREAYGFGYELKDDGKTEVE